ncbi:MAG: AAA family ATPase [Candidatus Komeilibacteria bacterium]
MEPVCIIMRGLPGSGKSHVASWLARKFQAVIASADDYFWQAGRYCFDPAQLSQAHAACHATFSGALASGQSVIVDNTASQLWEYEHYFQEAQARGYRVIIVEMEHGSFEDMAVFHDRNQHQVEWSAMMAMASRWEEDSRAILVRSSDISLLA